MLLSLIVRKPPFLRFNAGVVSHLWPQARVTGKSFNSVRYLNSISSLNSALFKGKPYCSRGMALNQDDAPG